MKKYIFLTLLFLGACQDPIVEEELSIKTQKIKTDDITIQIPVEINAETLFEIDLMFPKSVTIISSKLESVSMDMGVIPVIFKEDDSFKEFKAQMLVGACALPKMQWRLDIVWMQQGQRKVFSQIIDVKR